MPLGALPEEGKKIWEKVHDKALKTTCKDRSDPEECAAKIAWSAVKGAGWKKDGNDKWHKSNLTEFSLAITRASYDKVSNQMRWRAVASDTDEDSFGDSMSLKLFSKFVERVKSGEQPPEMFRSDFWAGGLPYLSVSHYPDLNGNGVPGDVEDIYIDGNRLKAVGIFSDTPLGRACFKSVCDDLYNKEKSDFEDKVRISIAFLDYAHKHKSNGNEFERKSLEEICPHCWEELIKGEIKGKEFLDGHLIHLAMTRVPVNKRTDMEVERSMTTRKEDASSIIGEELAEELEEQTSLVGKSEALIIKSEEENVLVEEAEHMDEDECKDKEGNVDEDCMKKMKAKKEKADLVERPNEKETKSEVEMRQELMQSLKTEIVEELKALISKPEPKAIPVHPLDGVITNLKAKYNALLEENTDEKFQEVKAEYEAVGKEIMKALELKEEPKEETPIAQPDLVAAFSEAMKPLMQEVSLLRAQMADNKPRMVGEVPVRRSIAPSALAMKPAEAQSETPKLRDMVRRSVGLQ